MVKRFVTFLFLFVFLLTLFVCPVFGADFMESDSDMFGFAFDDSKVFFTDKVLKGDAISVDTQLLQCSRLYFYIPVSKPVQSLDFYFSLIKTTGSINVTACDYGGLYNNDYHMTASLDMPTVSWMGSNATEGSTARFISFKCAWPSLPFTTSSSLRFIRLTVDYTGGSGNELVLWTQKNLTQGLSGVLGNPTYSFDGNLAQHNSSAISGSLTESGYYITGSKKYKYWNGSSAVTDTLTLSNGTGGSGGYLYVPSHTISVTSGNGLTFKTNATSITGSLTPSSASQQTDLQGTYLARNYVNTVTMSATRGYSDQELIQAVDDGFAQNHSDLQAISSQLGELVQHQDQVNQTGDDIGSTTSDSSISSTSGDLSSGSDGLSNVLSTASNISSVSGAASPYISFIGAAMPIILNFGNGVLAWAVVGIIACSVFLWILKKVAE